MSLWVFCQSFLLNKILFCENSSFLFYHFRDLNFIFKFNNEFVAKTTKSWQPQQAWQQQQQLLLLLLFQHNNDNNKNNNNNNQKNKIQQQQPKQPPSWFFQFFKMKNSTKIPNLFNNFETQFFVFCHSNKKHKIKIWHSLIFKLKFSKKGRDVCDEKFRVPAPSNKTTFQTKNHCKKKKWRQYKNFKNRFTAAIGVCVYLSPAPVILNFEFWFSTIIQYFEYIRLGQFVNLLYFNSSFWILLFSLSHYFNLKFWLLKKQLLLPFEFWNKFQNFKINCCEFLVSTSNWETTFVSSSVKDSGGIVVINSTN